MRLSVELMAAAENYVEQHGTTFNDLVGELLASHLRKQGVKVTAQTQEALPLTA
ncbi:hypothetical protein [Solihabitans fulvus]|uniref:hypothetical protein n=1 Tax=Solihabitans fulvus TaxID=1892852 RepID=UPI001661C481|nr:hypothetical protein [Solihabitans fulvus]